MTTQHSQAFPLSPQAAAVADELGRQATSKVRPASLAEGPGADRVESRCPRDVQNV